MSSQPLVSIITPSFNQAAYLEQTICSVLEQDYPRIEYLVIDGGSTDGSLEIIQKYAHNLAGWVSEADRGQADAINKGFQRVSGEIVAWLNSDDLYHPGAASAAVAAFKRNPQAGLVFSDVDSIDETGKTFNRMHYSDWGLEDLMIFRIIGQAGVFMRRSKLEQAGMLDTDYHFLLDHHLWLRIGLVTALAYVPGEPWAAARFHAAAKNVALATQFGEEAYRIVTWMEGNPEFAPLMWPIRRKVWAGAHRLNAFYLLDGNQPRAALSAYWKSLLQYPPAVLQDWYRILYALLNLLGLDGLRKAYLRWRRALYQRKMDG
ncbi:MAG: glycosyltransferase family 2 protein [Chloroflexota bacterium]